MAKLNVVVPAVDVTIERTVYTKVEREAVVGDVVRSETDDYADIEPGEYFRMVSGERGPYFLDNIGDKRDFSGRYTYTVERGDFTVFEKVAEKPQDDVITHEGRRYRKVARKANVGDFVIVLSRGTHKFRKGDVREITEVNEGNRNQTRRAGEGPSWLFEREYSVLEPLDPRSKFAVGEKVRLISGGGHFPLRGLIDGEVYTVGNPMYNGHPCGDVVIIEDDNDNYGAAKPEQLAKVTAEDLKWAAIGRKVNEFKAGDIVEITEGECGDRVGAVVDVEAVWADSLRYKSARCSGTYGASLSAVKLVTPVEQRFDR